MIDSNVVIFKDDSNDGPRKTTTTKRTNVGCQRMIAERIFRKQISHMKNSKKKKQNVENNTIEKNEKKKKFEANSQTLAPDRFIHILRCAR